MRNSDRGVTVADEAVRVWRTPEASRLLWMQGVTTSYRVDPAGEFVIGTPEGQGYRLRRGRSTTIVRPGQLVVLDPSAPHSGAPIAGAWAGRLLVIELPDLYAEVFDPDDRIVDLSFSDPVVEVAEAGLRFTALHRAMARPAGHLERQSMLTSFLDDLVRWSPSYDRRLYRAAGHDPAVRRAADYLRADVRRNVSLDELAAVAELSKYQFVRRFKAALGVPPHTFQIAQRVALARRLLERGEPPAEVASRAGFVDQSHLNRHFKPRLGMTPKQYALAARR